MTTKQFNLRTIFVSILIFLISIIFFVSFPFQKGNKIDDSQASPVAQALKVGDIQLAEALQQKSEVKTIQGVSFREFEFNLSSFELDTELEYKFELFNNSNQVLYISSTLDDTCQIAYMDDDNLGLVNSFPTLWASPVSDYEFMILYRCKASDTGSMDNSEKSYIYFLDNEVDLSKVSFLRITEEVTEPTMLAPGLYETGTTNLVKSYQQLLDDGDITITDGALKLFNISLKGDFVCGNSENITSLEGAFQESLFTSIDLSQLDTSNVTNMSCLFAESSFLTNVNLNNLDTSNVTNMASMFMDCIKLNNLDVSSFDTSNVVNMNNMFSYCLSLTTLNVSSFNTANVQDMSYIFGYCTSLTNIDISSFLISADCAANGLFDGCQSLTSVNLGYFDVNNSALYSSLPSSSHVLKDITYFGTLEEWHELYSAFASRPVIANNYNPLVGVTVHCSDGDIVLE